MLSDYIKQSDVDHPFMYDPKNNIKIHALNV